MIFFRSIRWQIQLWHGLIWVVIMAVVLGSFYRYEKKVRLQNINHELSGPIVTLLPLFVRPAEGPPPPPPPPGMPQKLEERGYYIAAWSPELKLLYRSDFSPEIPPLPHREHGRPNSVGRWNGKNYELIQISPQGAVVLVGMPGEKIERDLAIFAWKLTLLGVVLVAVGLAGGWWVAGRAIRPIEQIVSTAGRIASGDYADRIPVQNTSLELGRLAVILNDTFDRLHAAYDQQVRFTADASHELRTPVAVILAQTQVSLARERDAIRYKESLIICQRSAEKMKLLLNDLLDLSSYDAAAIKLRLLQCDLAEIVAESLEFIEPLASERKAVVTSHLTPIRGRYDPASLSHVLINLLTNAIKHNAEGVRIVVSLEAVEAGAKISISDDGIGIAPLALPHIFDRFYRVDAARSGGGGTGLGLAIARALVEAHGGTIQADSKPGHGTVLIISLPPVSNAEI